MKKLSITALLVSLFTGCATPMHQGDTTAVDDNTQVSYLARADGFDIAVTYSRYQFVPQLGQIREDCKSAVASLAVKHARDEGKQIKPIEAIRTSVGRNPLLGMSTCEASASVIYVG
jgi:hypothetical protein